MNNFQCFLIVTVVSLIPGRTQQAFVKKVVARM